MCLPFLLASCGAVLDFADPWREFREAFSMLLAGLATFLASRAKKVARPASFCEKAPVFCRLRVGVSAMLGFYSYFCPDLRGVCFVANVLPRIHLDLWQKK